MSVPVDTGLTYDDLASFPDDGLRRELIDGELFVSPSPVRDHQEAVEAVAAEVSSPSTRRLDLIGERALYEREGVGEYWFVDLDETVIDVYRLDGTGHHGTPTTLAPGDSLTCLAAPGFALPVADVFA